MDSTEVSLSTVVQRNPSKADNLEPHILSITVGCPLWRGCIDVNWKQSGPRNLSVISRHSVIEGCPLSRVPLYLLYRGGAWCLAS